MMIENGHDLVVKILLAEELEVLERVDPETLDESLFFTASNDGEDEL